MQDHCENKIVKVIVRKKSDQVNSLKNLLINFIHLINDLKIVENFHFSGWYSKEDF